MSTMTEDHGGDTGKEAAAAGVVVQEGQARIQFRSEAEVFYNPGRRPFYPTC